MKKVMIITYYWPPSGGSGVQRWLKHTKYLPEFGWQPYIFTPENPSFDVKDESLLNDIPASVEVIKLPIWEPYTLFNKGKKNQQTDLVKKKKKSLIGKLMLWVRGNFFIPDPRKFWVKPASKVLVDLLVSNGIDIMITTGPPHSMHMIGLKVKKKLNIKWVADFRDPWSQWGLFDSFYLTGLAKSQHRKLEHKVLKTADRVVTVSDHYAEGLKSLCHREIDVITNGFDATDFDANEQQQPKEFIIRHVGVVDEHRDPRPVLQAIEELADEGLNCPIEFVGNVNATLRAEIAANHKLTGLVKLTSYVPHSEVYALYQQSAVLLSLPMNSANAKGNIPGKIFEYLAAQRPILALGDKDFDSARIVEESAAGIVVKPTDVKDIKEAIKTLKHYFEKGVTPKSKSIAQYTRKNLTQKYAQLLDKL